MVREVTSAYADHLRERLGATSGGATVAPDRGRDSRRFRWESMSIATIPPVPPNGPRRGRSLGLADDEVAILYVGRLSHHAKAHPFPMFKSVSEAARSSGRRVHLILAGWAAHPAVHEAFVGGASGSRPT